MDFNALMSSVLDKAVQMTVKGPHGADYKQIEDQLRDRRNQNKSEVQKIPRAVEAFFIGPRGENAEFFRELIANSVTSHIIARKSYEMEDVRHITREMQKQPTFMQAQDSLERSLNYLLTKLRDLSPPYFSPRYFGHMCWQTSIPAMVGYFATMLYNPNNTAFEASPFTTQLQIDCMVEFAEMFKYPPMLTGLSGASGVSNSWGHLTCGGTVANSEAFWAARSVKYLSFGLKKYVQSLTGETYEKVKNVQVKLANGTMQNLVETSVWDVINVPNDEAMNLNDEVFRLAYDNNPDKYQQYQDAVAPFTLGKMGFINLANALEAENKLHPDPLWEDNKVPSPLSFYSATGHYSMPKAVSVLGMGESAIHKIEVDLDTRMDCVKLEATLNDCLEKHVPVLVVVGIVGSTEESTADNLVEILNVKERMAQKGLFFHFHIDGAYGSYFVSMMREIQPNQINSLSPYMTSVLEAFYRSDSITFDPHKTGYVPYACGGIIYRNYRLRNNLTFSAPYIFTGFQPNNAIYGIEGSKPGAAVSAVYVSLEVMPLIRSGHGELLERTMMNTKIFTCSLYGMQETTFKFNINGTLYTENFRCCVLPRTYVEKHNVPEEKEAQDAAYKKIASTKVTDMQELIKDPSVGKYYYEVGPDLNIVCYCVNFKDRETGEWNTSLAKLKKFNETLVYLSKPVGDDVSVRCKDLYVSETTIGHSYGDVLFNDFLARNNLVNDASSIEFIRSTIMNPFFTEQSTDKPNSTFINELAENSCETLDYLAKNGWQ